ncbi:MAG TPA: methyltransferase domain-containing protein [Vicinamibacteria bacterium]
MVPSWADLALVCPACRAPLFCGPGGASCPSCGARYEVRDGVLDLRVGREGAPGFDPHYFSFLAEYDRRHFWFKGRREVVREALQRVIADPERHRLFDVGCGSGGLLEFLVSQGIRVAGACDAYAESLRLVRQRVDAPLVLTDEGRLPPLGAGQTLLGLFDVLEHIDDDQGTLGFLFSVLEPGGVLALTVPAHPFLFDEMDVLAHHRRRYVRSELRRKLEHAGFRVERITHFMSPLVAPLLVMRSLGRLFGGRRSAGSRRALELRPLPGLNEVLTLLLSVERLLLRFVSLPFGSSILAVAVRPDVNDPARIGRR